MNQYEAIVWLGMIAAALWAIVVVRMISAFEALGTPVVIDDDDDDDTDDPEEVEVDDDDGEAWKRA